MKKLDKHFKGVKRWQHKKNYARPGREGDNPVHIANKDHKMPRHSRKHRG